MEYQKVTRESKDGRGSECPGGVLTKRSECISNEQVVERNNRDPLSSGHFNRIVRQSNNEEREKRKHHTMTVPVE